MEQFLKVRSQSYAGALGEIQEVSLLIALCSFRMVLGASQKVQSFSCFERLQPHFFTLFTFFIFSSDFSFHSCCVTSFHLYKTWDE